MVVGIILFAISLLGVLGLGFFAIKRVAEVLHPIVPVNFKDFLKKNLIITIIFSIVRHKSVASTTETISPICFPLLSVKGKA